MRVLILILILLVPLSSNTFAMSAGDLYKYCKPYADRALIKLGSNVTVWRSDEIQALVDEVCTKGRTRDAA